MKAVDLQQNAIAFYKAKMQSAHEKRDTEFRRRLHRPLTPGQLLTPEQKTPVWETNIPGKQDTIGYVDTFEPCVLLEDDRERGGFLKILWACGVGYVDNDYMVEHEDS